jgi:hypothetical protein
MSKNDIITKSGELIDKNPDIVEELLKNDKYIIKVHAEELESGNIISKGFSIYKKIAHLPDEEYYNILDKHYNFKKNKNQEGE